VLRAPFLRVDPVEQLVVAGDEVAPLDDLQRLLLGLGALREEEAGGESCRRGGTACDLDELSSADLFRHGHLPSVPDHTPETFGGSRTSEGHETVAGSRGFGDAGGRRGRAARGCAAAAASAVLP